MVTDALRLRRAAGRVAAVLLLGLTLVSGPATAVEISDVRSGLVCSEYGRPAWVCHETGDIHITGASRCVYDGRQEPCTWYGFSFEYTGNVPGTLLDCEFEYTRPTTHGNPAKIVDENVTSGRYALPLEHANGRFFNRQYTLFDAAGVADSDPANLMATRCSIAGRQVLDFRFTVHAPVPAGQAVTR